MTLENIRHILREACETGTVRSIYFEGGEPFLYYATLLCGVRLAVEMGFQAGIVSNAYWATSLEDAIEYLRPFTTLINDLSVSSDLYHYDEKLSWQARYATVAATQLGIPVGTLSIAQPEEANAISATGELKGEAVGVMYRGRAAEKLAPRVPQHGWKQFTECPHEDLREPGRVHVDPFGNLHICQGIVIGNLFEQPLRQICETYNAEAHPIIGPLLRGGPAELARQSDISHQNRYADACHLCYETRRALRERFPVLLKPDGMYGIMEPTR
jgi:hypothetical protein